MAFCVLSLVGTTFPRKVLYAIHFNQNYSSVEIEKHTYERFNILDTLRLGSLTQKKKTRKRKYGKGTACLVSLGWACASTYKWDRAGTLHFTFSQSHYNLAFSKTKG